MFLMAVPLSMVVWIPSSIAVNSSDGMDIGGVGMVAQPAGIGLTT